MSDWSLSGGSYPSCSYHPYAHYPSNGIQQASTCERPTQAHPLLPPVKSPTIPKPLRPQPPKGESSRETRNKAEKQRRDKMTQSIYRLASIVPPVATSGKKVDKTSVLRMTAHFLRSHHHVFGKSLYRGPKFSVNFTQAFLKTMKGFLLTSTYKGLMVVVSPNVQEYLGYTECELLGRSLYSIVHPDDHQLLKKQLYPRCCRLTSNGELLLSQDIDAAKNAAEALMNEKRAFLLRIKKQTHLRTEPVQYLTCHVDGTFRKSDRAGVFVDTVVQIGRRVRSRGNNPYASGNDIVFIGMIRPVSDTFATESKIECFTMEYRTRHSIDGGIIQCEQRIALVTGYMVHEVKGVNAMNFMHRDDVRWVIVALREMYVNHLLIGESCYRLMTKNGQFIYLRTRGALEVDADSKATTSFVCTNTLVPEQEGIELIRLMKNKFSLKINNEELKDEDTNINSEVNEKQFLTVEDPRQLEQVIYHLVTDLPSPQPEENTLKSCEVSRAELVIMPPKKDQIKKAIQKSYSVIKNLRSFKRTENMSYNRVPSNPPHDPDAGTPEDISENLAPGLQQCLLPSIQNSPLNGVPQPIDRPSGERVSRPSQLFVIRNSFVNVGLDNAWAQQANPSPTTIQNFEIYNPNPEQNVNIEVWELVNANSMPQWQPDGAYAVFPNMFNSNVESTQDTSNQPPLPMSSEDYETTEDVQNYDYLTSPSPFNITNTGHFECGINSCDSAQECPFSYTSEKPSSSLTTSTIVTNNLPMETNESREDTSLSIELTPTMNRIIEDVVTTTAISEEIPEINLLENFSEEDELVADAAEVETYVEAEAEVEAGTSTVSVTTNQVIEINNVKSPQALNVPVITKQVIEISNVESPQPLNEPVITNQVTEMSNAESPQALNKPVIELCNVESPQALNEPVIEISNVESPRVLPLPVTTNQVNEISNVESPEVNPDLPQLPDPYEFSDSVDEPVK